MLGTYWVYNTILLSCYSSLRFFNLLSFCVVVYIKYLCWHIHVIYFLLWYKTHSVLM
jgi:hypothetical protein